MHGTWETHMLQSWTKWSGSRLYPSELFQYLLVLTAFKTNLDQSSGGQLCRLGRPIQTLCRCHLFEGCRGLSGEVYKAMMTSVENTSANRSSEIIADDLAQSAEVRKHTIDRPRQTILEHLRRRCSRSVRIPRQTLTDSD